jgi:hypothetical protein
MTEDSLALVTPDLAEMEFLALILTSVLKVLMTVMVMLSAQILSVDSNVTVTVVLTDPDTEMLVARILMSVLDKLMSVILTLAALILPEDTIVTATTDLLETVCLVKISMSA